MIPLGLSGSDQQTYHDGLRDDHQIHVRVQILQINHDPISDVSHMLYDGQVDVDQHADVTRSLSLSLLDPRGSLPFDSDSPADGALFMNRMIRVTYSAYIDALTDWVDVPVFTGPVTKLDRQDDVVEIEAQGKEILAMGAAWHPHVIRKGTPVTTAIWLIMSQLYRGENFRDMPDLPNRMSRELSISREDSPWGKAVQLANAIGRQLFYDGRGVLRLRHRPQVPHFTFDGRSVCGPMQVSFSPITTNMVNVVGGIPPKKKKPVTVTARPALDNPLSPWQLLDNNGFGRFLVDFVTNDQVRTTADARTLAQTTLAAALRMPVEVSFDGLPVPHLEPGDMAQVATGRGSVVFPLRQFSLPLVAADGNNASYGALRNVRVRRRRARR